MIYQHVICQHIDKNIYYIKVHKKENILNLYL